MDIMGAFGLAGHCQGAADICSTTHWTVKKIVIRDHHSISALSQRKGNLRFVAGGDSLTVVLHQC